ncbi:MAG: PadR family transcriptional regulator, partial [Bryobacterales bacterium]|nr:PadR family transcriptional regulator [Bryobacterales bacterium]
RNELLPGTLDMLVMKALMQGALHGYAIAQHLRAVSREFLQVEEGSLYPALQRLELNGFLKGEWTTTANNRRARVYQLTAEGRKQLEAEVGRYRQMTAAIDSILEWAQ